MAPQRKITDEQLLAAINGSGGILSTVAARCAKLFEVTISRQAIAARAKSTEGIRKALAEAKEIVLDTAESKLFHAVRAGKPWAVRFILARLGAERGYAKKVEMEGEGMGEVHIILPDCGRVLDGHLHDGAN